MADNYLEKRMADYRSGRSALSVRKVSLGPSAGRFAVKIPSVRILAIGDIMGSLEKTVTLLSQCGCKVAFAAEGNVENQKFSQRTGTLLVPVAEDMSDAIKERIYEEMSDRWGGVDVVLCVGESNVSIEYGADNIRVLCINSGIKPYSRIYPTLCVELSEPDSHAELIAWLCMPQSVPLFSCQGV